MQDAGALGRGKALSCWPGSEVETGNSDTGLAGGDTLSGWESCQLRDQVESGHFYRDPRP